MNKIGLSGLFPVLLLFCLSFFPAASLIAQNFGSSPGQNGKTLNIEEALTALGSGAELRWDPFFASGALIAGGYAASFVSGAAGETGMVLLEHRDVLTLPLPFMEKGVLKFPEVFITQIKSNFARYNEEYRSQYRIAAIIIDPGHGGKDPGASWDYKIDGKIFKSVEKEITLKVGEMLYAALATAYPAKKVLLTRDKDDTLTLEERVNQANSIPLAGNEAAIFISLHANSSLSNRNARGYEVWYLSPSYRREVIDRSKYTDSNEVLPILNSMLEEEITTESILLANSILKRLGDAIGKQSPSRGLKAEEWFVVRNARMPSVLVELGFVSNESEALLLNDNAYLKKLSEALYNGIRDFIAFFERSGGMTALQ